MATKIETAMQSPYTKPNRYGDLACLWYENGQEQTATVKVNKQDRDYTYNEVLKAYNRLIAQAPEANRPIIRTIVEHFMADNFTADAYFVDVAVSANNPMQMINNLKPYYNK